VTVILREAGDAIRFNGKSLIISMLGDESERGSFLKYLFANLRTRSRIINERRISRIPAVARTCALGRCGSMSTGGALRDSQVKTGRRL
jgi:hypothetical protein